MDEIQSTVGTPADYNLSGNMCVSSKDGRTSFTQKMIIVEKKKT